MGRPTTWNTRAFSDKLDKLLLDANGHGSLAKIAIEYGISRASLYRRKKILLEASNTQKSEPKSKNLNPAKKPKKRFSPYEKKPEEHKPAPRNPRSRFRRPDFFEEDLTQMTRGAL